MRPARVPSVSSLVRQRAAALWPRPCKGFLPSPPGVSEKKRSQGAPKAPPHARRRTLRREEPTFFSSATYFRMTILIPYHFLSALRRQVLRVVRGA
eukprot:1952415-Pyramimonas_sp.AAC.3